MHTTTGLLSVQVKSRSASWSLRAVVKLQPHQARYQSSAPGNNDEAPKQEKRDRPQMSFRQFVGRALGASLRNLAVALSPRGIRTAYKDSPVVTSMNIILYILLSSNCHSRSCAMC